MQVAKRDGKLVDFDKSKIRVAIEKANREVRPRERATKEEIKEILELSDRIEGVKSNIRDRKTIKDIAQKVKVKELEEPINLDQWKALGDPEEEMIR